MAVPNLTPFFRLFDDFLDYIYMMDEIFGIITFLIAMLISYYSLKIFDFTKRKNYFWFSGAFFLIAIGFLLRFIFDFMYETATIRKSMFLGTFDFDLFQTLLILSYMFFVLAGYILLLIIALDIKKRVSLLIFIISFAALFVSMNYHFTFLVIILIVLGTLLVHFDRNFDKKRTLNAGIVWFSFILIFFGYLLQMLIFFSNKFYLLSVLFNMGGFLLLLLNFVLVLKK